ncbi:unnamed protein product [Rhizophagus irregularis]|nr:unnamed protein product [Rhizophagus irregularis]
MLDKQFNLDYIDTSNTNNEFFHIIKDFDKINIKEIKPTIENISEYIYEGDLSIVIDELVNLIFVKINEGKNEKMIKLFVLNYINSNEIIPQEIHNWLLNNQNNSNSIYLLGYFYYNGIGTDLNKQKAIQLCQKAADLDNRVAQIDLANVYLLGKGVDKNYKLAFELSKKLADGEFVSGINNLGYCYNWGIGTDVNKQKAFELYQKAADLENLTGINNLGWCYEKGIGTNVDKQKTFELYQKAANLGSDIAQYNLAYMYEIGDGIKKDMDKAIYWYKKSAEQGDEIAQSKLEELLEK